MQNQEVIRIEDETADGLALFDRPEVESFRDNILLEGLNPSIYAQLERRIEVVHCPPRTVIFEEEGPGDSLYLIAEGSVQISKRGRAGQQETLAHLMERDFFGEMALVDRGRRSAQATAVGHVVLGRIDSETWDLLLHLAPHEILHNFTHAVTKRLRQNNQHFIEQMMRTERLSLLGSTISSIVHDMNNPIGAILGACEVMQRSSHDASTTKMTHIIRDSVDRMRSMTRELIDFSRGNTDLNLQPLSVPELLGALEPDFADCRPEIEVEVVQNYYGNFLGDRHRLLRVFSNLIQNGREAMQRSPRRRLKFYAARLENKVCFEISDTGCGIPSEIQPRVFEPFLTFGKANGTGLGLAISKAVIEAHKGTISVTSGEHGTIIYLALPIGT